MRGSIQMVLADKRPEGSLAFNMNFCLITECAHHTMHEDIKNCHSHNLNMQLDVSFAISEACCYPLLSAHC